MLTGQLPYDGPTEQVIYGHLLAPIPSIVTRSGGRVPAVVQGLLDRALAKDPTARFASAGELARAYTALGEGRAASELRPAVPEPLMPYAPQ